MRVTACIPFFRKRKKKETWNIPFVRIEKVVSTRAQDWREMLLTISTGLNKVGNFIRFSSVPASMVKIKEGWIEGQGGWRGFVSRCNFKLADWPRV